MATTFLVCAPRGYFGDDVHTVCDKCGAAIVHRPHAPAEAVKVCIPCAAKVIRAEETQGRPVGVYVTPETRREKALYDAQTKGTQ